MRGGGVKHAGSSVADIHVSAIGHGTEVDRAITGLFCASARIGSESGAAREGAVMVAAAQIDGVARIARVIEIPKPQKPAAAVGGFIEADSCRSGTPLRIVKGFVSAGPLQAGRIIVGHQHASHCSGSD